MSDDDDDEYLVKSDGRRRSEDRQVKRRDDSSRDCSNLHKKIKMCPWYCKHEKKARRRTNSCRRKPQILSVLNSLVIVEISSTIKRPGFVINHACWISRGGVLAIGGND